MEKYSDLTYFDTKQGVLLSFTSSGVFSDIGEVSKAANIPTKIKYWGDDNLLPLRRELMLMESNIVGQLISKKRDILLGQGIMPYKEVFENGNKEIIPLQMDPKIQEWIDESNYNEKYEDEAVLNFYKHANVFAEVVMNKAGGVFSITCHDSKYVRAAEKMKGKIPAYYVCADWKKKIDDKDNPLFVVPAYDPEKNQPKFMLHLGDNIFHDGYYFHPAYWGGEEWIDLANLIPIFHKANIKNGYTLRWHIKIPKDYFLDRVAYNQITGDEEKKKCIQNAEAAKQKFLDDMNNFLAGENNAGRAIYTVEDFDVMLKEWKGIKVEPIEFDMKDESLLKLFETSDRANIAGQGLPPTLAGIETQGKLSSGSDIRNSLMYYIISSLFRPRRILLKPFEMMLKLNGWYDPAVKYTFEDVLITKLDENKSGVQPINNGSNETK